MTAPTVKPIIDLDQTGRLLRRVEAHHEATGWTGGPAPVVYVAYDGGDVTVAHHIERIMAGMGASIRTSRYSAQPMIPERMFKKAFLASGKQPVDALANLALNIAYADPGLVNDYAGEGMDEQFVLFRRLLQEPGVLGFLYHCEAFSVLGPGAASAVPGLVREHPDAKDSRIVHMVDTLDRVHHVHRIRGQVAALNLNAALDGYITGSLRMLADATMRRLPDLGADFNTRYNR